MKNGEAASAGWRRHTDRELVGGVVQTVNELVGLEVQHGADGRLIQPAGLEEVCLSPSRGAGVFRGQVNLSQAPIDQCGIDLNKEVEAGEGTGLTETASGFLGPGDGVPNVALRLRQRAPTGGDRAESPADSDLGGGAGVGRDKGRIAVLGVTITLPDCVSAFA